MRPCSIKDITSEEKNRPANPKQSNPVATSMDKGNTHRMPHEDLMSLVVIFSLIVLAILPHYYFIRKTVRIVSVTWMSLRTLPYGSGINLYVSRP